jgi:hypothetical protein
MARPRTNFLLHCPVLRSTSATFSGKRLVLNFCQTHRVARFMRLNHNIFKVFVFYSAMILIHRTTSSLTSSIPTKSSTVLLFVKMRSLASRGKKCRSIPTSGLFDRFRDQLRHFLHKQSEGHIRLLFCTSLLHASFLQMAIGRSGCDEFALLGRDAA